jgi:hypothetical protein
MTRLDWSKAKQADPRPQENPYLEAGANRLLQEANTCSSTKHRRKSKRNHLPRRSNKLVDTWAANPIGEKPPWVE